MEKVVAVNSSHPELDSETRMEGSVIECLDQMESQIFDLSDRLHQVMAISIVARRNLEDTLACSCCADSTLTGIFRAIETITGGRNS